jgi:hypothetical protein
MSDAFTGFKEALYTLGCLIFVLGLAGGVLIAIGFYLLGR